jgi:hypothetical protein
LSSPPTVKYNLLSVFFNARNVKLADIHDGENAMSDGMVMKWVRKFKKGQDNVHDKLQSGRPSVVSGVFTGGRVLRGGDTETGAPL